MFNKSKQKSDKSKQKHKMNKDDGKVMKLSLHKKEWYNIMTALVDANKQLDCEYKELPKNCKEKQIVQNWKKSNMKIYRKISDEFYGKGR